LTRQPNGDPCLRFTILRCIAKRRSAVRSDELREETGFYRQRLAHHLDALLKDGLITRRHDDADRRFYWYAITDLGREQLQRLNQLNSARKRRRNAKNPH